MDTWRGKGADWGAEKINRSKDNSVKDIWPLNGPISMGREN
jgi:hypothetical protein